MSPTTISLFSLLFIFNFNVLDTYFFGFISLVFVCLTDARARPTSIGYSLEIQMQFMGLFGFVCVERAVKHNSLRVAVLVLLRVGRVCVCINLVECWNSFE